MNHTRFPKEDHLPDWARRDNKVTKGGRVDCIYNHLPEDETSGSKHAEDINKLKIKVLI